MSDFVYLFRATDALRNEHMGTPERAQKSLQAWLAWIEELESKGHLKNRGQPLDRTGKVVRGKKRLVTDGPYIEAKDLVLGFIMIVVCVNIVSSDVIGRIGNRSLSLFGGRSISV